MSLKQQILEDIKSAMKQRESEKLEVLRYINSQIKNKEIEVRPKELSDQDVMSVLKKYLKQRTEATEQFKQAGRQDLVDKESFQAEVAKSYLPQMLSEEELQALVEEVVAESQATSMKDMGRVMKSVMDKSKGLADGKMLSSIVKAKLA